LYPTRNGLNDLAVEPQYQGNSFNGEQAITDALKDSYKYDPDAGPNQPAFVNRIVEKLWSGAKEMPWNEVKSRAATDPSWIWHHPRALDDVRDAMISRDQWRGIGNGFVERGPFPPPRPTAEVRLLSRDDTTGEATLRVKPLHGDTLYLQNGASGAREKLTSYDVKTRALRLTLTAANTENGMEGDPVPWTNTINLKYRLFGGPGERMCEVQALPSGAIRYTTDGSSPASSGQPYQGPFRVPAGATLILAQASADGVVSELLRVDAPKDGRADDSGGEVWRVDTGKPATWRKGHKLDATSEVFTFLDQAIRQGATLGGVRVTAMKGKQWAELSLDEGTYLGSEKVRDQATQLRELIPGANLTLEVAALQLLDGQRLLDLTRELKETPMRYEVTQS
ncbi:MAG TPA: chitobiase/beta-hexosaminidase C-terminal domain-containing protein, partial [Ktedonobacterales bacterium]|nr:chitobiase/beta-hexosaminidase C-terminal domain-containing protein [Ktedonobacterales bacterium]